MSSFNSQLKYSLASLREMRVKASLVLHEGPFCHLGGTSVTTSDALKRGDVYHHEIQPGGKRGQEIL